MIMKKAFSLIEMIVAVLLISILLGIATFAFKYQLIAIHKTQKIGINDVINYNQLRASLESAKFYVVDDYDMLGKPMRNLHFYFTGTENKINYITENPVFSKNIALARLRCEGTNLIYDEQKLYGSMDFLNPSFTNNRKEMIFYSNLDHCGFLYKEKKWKKNIQRHVPKAVVLNLSSNAVTNNIYISIKNDNNTSKDIIYETIYSDKDN